MSLILKSNIVATRSLGNINGIKGSQDWLYFADLEGGTIAKRDGSTVGYTSDNELFKNTGTLNMAAKPVTMSPDGAIGYIADATKLRYLLDPSNGRYGLAAESNSRSNYISLSTTPANQTVSLAASVALSVSVKGSGSMTLTSANFSDTYIVTEGNPVSIKPNDSIAFDVVVTVSGQLSHAQIERTSGITSVASQITTPTMLTGKNILKGLDRIEIQDAIVGALTSDNADGITIVFQHIPYRLLQEVRTTPMFERRIDIETFDNKTLAVTAIIEKDRTFTSRQGQYTADSTESNPALGNNGVMTVGNGMVIAVSIKNNKLLTSINGSPSTESNTTVAIDSLSSIALAPEKKVYQGVGGSGIITKLALYKKSMSSTDLAELSKSWL